jgi:carboxylate-amine ligase
LRDIDENVPHTDLPGRLIEENMWRAIRFGLDGQMIDFEHGETYPSARIAERLLAWTAPVRAELDLEPVLPERNSAQRQRAMIDAGAPPFEVYDATVRETRATYAEEVTA